MGKLLIPVIFILLFSAACRGGGGVEWQPNSTKPPQFDGQTLPRLLVQPTAGSGSLVVLDIGAGQSTSQTLTRATGLNAVLAGEHQVAGDILAGQGQFFGLTVGSAAPTGLWLATEQGGLRLFRVDGVETTLSTNGRFPVWSPDGQWLAYQDDAGLWAVNVGADLTPQQLRTTTYEPLAWSADNRQLLLRNGKSAVLFTIATQQSTTLRGVDASQLHDQPTWSPDSQTIYARYGNNGRVAVAGPGQPDNMQARLVAITLDGSRDPLRDLLPNQRNLGVTDFLLSPAGDLLVARQFGCGNKPNGLIPFILTRVCTGWLLLVESASGYYQTIPDGPIVGAMAWERPLPPINLADLPLPTSSGAAPVANEHPFWRPDAEPGQNPATAVPLGQTGERLGTLTTVVEVAQGGAALALALNADPPLLPPGAGYAYVAIHQRVTREAGQSAFYFSTNNLLIDDRLAAHGEIAWLDAAGQVIKELRYSADDPADHWQFFILEADAQPWLLFAPAGADNLLDLYYRLDEADWNPPPAATVPLPPNNIGVAEAARVGETAVSPDWQLTLLEANSVARWASAPELVLLQIGYTGAAPKENRLLTCVGSHLFQDAASGLVVQSDHYRSLPFQNFSRITCLLPGGQFRGWLAALPEYGEETAVFRFNPPRSVMFGERLFAFLAPAGE
ncbi:MAG: PD40 domain-containing protein [Anaerolinea sp.]|nr:PD40 domain-containing protein [Anaerolinea sp.]